MKQILTILLLTFLFASCGMTNKKHIQHLEGSRQFAITDNTFKPFIDSFTLNARKYQGNSTFVVGDIPINFGDTGNTKFDGVCNSYSDGTKEVIIKKDWWNSASNHQKEIMIYHELGHCSLNRDHDSEIFSKDNYVVKASIMNPVIPGSGHYANYKTAYLTELFTYDKSPLESAVAL